MKTTKLKPGDILPPDYYVTPIYNRRAEKTYRQKKVKKGYKYFSCLTLPLIVDELKLKYRQLRERYGV